MDSSDVPEKAKSPIRFSLQSGAKVTVGGVPMDVIAAPLGALTEPEQTALGAALAEKAQQGYALAAAAELLLQDVAGSTAEGSLEGSVLVRNVPPQARRVLDAAGIGRLVNIK